MIKFAINKQTMKSKKHSQKIEKSEPHTAMLTRNIHVQTLKQDEIAKTTYQSMTD